MIAIAEVEVADQSNEQDLYRYIEMNRIAVLDGVEVVAVAVDIVVGYTDIGMAVRNAMEVEQGHYR